MAKTPSNMIALGTKAVDFKLLDTVSGKQVSLQETKSDIATVIMFICNHCPFVKHVQQGLVDLANDYMPRGISFIAINSNDAVQYPEDSPENMTEEAKRAGYKFPYLFDADQSVAKAYEAACTPDFYIFDADLKLVYRGQLDDSRPGSGIPVTGKDIRGALDSLLNGQQVTEEQRPSLGCNIKWKDA